MHAVNILLQYLTTIIVLGNLKQVDVAYKHVSQQVSLIDANTIALGELVWIQDRIHVFIKLYSDNVMMS